MSTVKEFMDLFAGLNRAYGTYQVLQQEETGKNTGQAITKRATVTEELWQGHLSGKMGIGIVPIDDDNTCRFGAIDVDGNSGHYKEFDAADFARRAAETKLPVTVCRSKSGGAHIYLFASEPVAAADMQARLRDMLPYFNLPKSVEIFPKQIRISSSREDIGSWINMPYFDAEATVRYAYDTEGNRLSSEDFIRVARAKIQGKAFFAAAIPPPSHPFEQMLVTKEDPGQQAELVATAWFPDGPPCLQQLAVEGIPAGNRNNAMLNIGRYFKIVDDNWREKVRSCNEEIFVPALEPSEINQLLRQIDGKGYQYTCGKEPLMSRCNGAVCRGRKYGVGRDGKRGLLSPKVSAGEADEPTAPAMIETPEGFPVLGQLRKLTTSFGAMDAIKYFLDVDSEPLQLDPADLDEPRKFISKVLHLGRRGYKMSMPTSESWDKMINDLTSRMITIELPDVASQDGQFWSHFELFCQHHRAVARDEVSNGRVWENEGRLYFTLPPLIQYMRRIARMEVPIDDINGIFWHHKVMFTRLNIRGVEMPVYSAPVFTVRDPRPENPNEAVVL